MGPDDDIQSSGPGIYKGRNRNVHTMLIATTILFTIISTVLIGIIAGYASIWGILAVFGRRSATPEAALVHPTTALANQ